MKTKKLIPFFLSCLLVLETPLVSQAAELPSNPGTETAILSGTETAILSGTETAILSETGIQDGASELPDDSAMPDIDFSITLSQETANLDAGDTLQLTASALGYDSSTADAPLQITWSSDHPEIASVSDEGLVNALQGGTASLTATAAFSMAGVSYTASASCIVTVSNTITLNKKKLVLYSCETADLTATANPKGKISWNTSDKSVVSVEKGKVKPKKAGSATITATANGVSASCEVTVKQPKLELPGSKTVYIKNPISLKASATPKGVISWHSSNLKVAEVSPKGKVTPHKTGTVKISASCNGIKKTCTVTVKNPSVKLKSKNVIIFAENDFSLNASAHPAEGLTYQSSKPRIAKVAEDGTITGVRPGTATITASVPGAKASCEVTVLKNDYKLSRSSQTLMKGSSITVYLSNTSISDHVSFTLSDPSIADLKPSGDTCKITGRKAGKTTLHASYSIYKDGQRVTCERSCTIKVINSGIVQQQAAVAVGADKTLSLKRVDKSGVKITGTTWKSSNPKIAHVDRKSGKVRGRKYGPAKITATVSYSDGTAKEYITNLKVSQPKTTYKRTVVSLGHSRKIAMSGLTSYSSTTWKLNKKSLVTIDPDGTVTAGKKAGETALTINVDGRSIKHTIVVTNPSLKSDYALLAPGKTESIKLSGVSAQSKISYHSWKKSIATVNDTGVVTAKKCGITNITVRVDGNSFVFQVEVVPQRAIDARGNGYNIMYSSSYSQARRMSVGYYDCSSLVFRAYGCDTGLLGGIPTWAPTAASMASHLERTGKVISYHGLSASQLRIGDLIFYSAPYNNGRYKNIYHVSMYYGGGYRLEKPLRYYYPEGNIVMIARPIK